MIKIKADYKELRKWVPPKYLEGSIFAYGMPGAGKSVSLKSIIEYYHDEYGYKIFDIYGHTRHEGIFWTLPSDETQYWAKYYALGSPDEGGPKQYKVNLLYPFFASKAPKKLPKKEGFVTSKLFTIPIKDVEVDDIRVVLDNVSDTTKFQWNEIKSLMKKTSNAGDLLELAKRIKADNSLLYKNFIVPMAREKFLMEEYSDYKLDLIAEAKDQEAITVLCLEYVPKEFHLFVIDYFIRKMRELVEVNKIPKKNINFIREAAVFFRAIDDSISENRFKAFKSHLSDYCRMTRSGIYFVMDCQSPSETKGLVSGTENLTLMFNMTSWRDKQELTEELRKEKRIQPRQIADLALLEKGQCYANETRKNVKKVQVSLPRTMFWKKEYGNFYKSLWESKGGKWENMQQVKDDIIKACIREPPKKVIKKEIKTVTEIAPEPVTNKSGDIFEELMKQF